MDPYHNDAITEMRTVADASITRLRDLLPKATPDEASIIRDMLDANAGIVATMLRMQQIQPHDHTPPPNPAR